MAILEINGLLNGKRLRQCSPAARWAFPYYYLLSNGFARIELDWDAIAEHFISFRGSAPTASVVKQHFTEYSENHLIFTYTANNKYWGQWDTERCRTPRHKTSSDRKSPSPPEIAYREWLNDQHHDDWYRFHWSSTPDKESVSNQQVHKSSENLREFPKVSEYLCPGGGVGVGVGGGGGEGKNKEPDDDLQKIETQQDFTPDDLAPDLLRRMGIGSKPETQNAAHQALTIKAGQPGWNTQRAFEHILLRWGEFKKSPKFNSQFKPKAENWLIESDYDNPESWKLLNGKSPPKNSNGSAPSAMSEINERKRILAAKGVKFDKE